MAKDMLWFRHDTNARSDDKLVRLQMDHGMAGIGIYWCIIEMLYEQMGSMRLQCERIAFELRTHSETVSDVLQKYELFKIEGDVVTCERVTQTINQNFVKSKGARKAALSRWKDAGALQTQSESNANAMHKRREEKKEEEKKVDEAPPVSEIPILPSAEIQKAPGRKVAPGRAEFSAPTQTEVEEYFTANGYAKEAGAKAFRYYDTAGWKDSKGNKVKNWKQKMQGVWFKDENKAKAQVSQDCSDFQTAEFTRYSPGTGKYYR